MVCKSVHFYSGFRSLTLQALRSLDSCWKDETERRNLWSRHPAANRHEEKTVLILKPQGP
eukprot:606186-Amphidinium_carterae.1